MLELFDFAVTQTAYVKAAMDEIPAYRPDGLTPAQVQALVDSATPVRAAYVTKKEAITGARALRHTSIDALHEACVEFAEQGKSIYRKNATVMARFARLPVQDQTFQETLTRGTASEALWTALPQVGTPPAAFTVRQETTTLALAGFTALITAARAADGAIPATDQDFQAAEADVHAKQSELEDFVTAALEQGRSQFAVGTPQREIIDAIPNAPVGGGGTPAPGQATVTAVEPGGGSNWVVSYSASAEVTAWKVESLAPGAEEWVVLAEDHSGPTYDLGELTSGGWQVRVTALGPVGAGPVSEPFPFTA